MGDINAILINQSAAAVCMNILVYPVPVGIINLKIGAISDRAVLPSGVARSLVHCPKNFHTLHTVGASVR